MTLHQTYDGFLIVFLDATRTTLIPSTLPSFNLPIKNYPS